ncbi:glycosyltransferase [Cognataquiflexum rubidum]|uniref:glycosyltransferase n=1 Tax=Cognataquiflexum rubidum TaxID=2922273 RepID=UPI001F12BD52|nr:glycosyltransferase [Cognataquiflexum rubidum]MCH6236518.1 glycosyltransferase [Cognataquiflexum rubidum]
MKIIRIVPYLDFGGVEKRLELTAKGFLKKKKHELIIIVLSTIGSTGEKISDMGFDVISLDRNPKIPNIGIIRKLYAIFKSLQPDVIHCSGSEANFHGLIAAYLAGVPVRIGEEIGFPNHDWKWRLIFRLTFNLAHQVIGISEAVKQRIVDLGEVNGDKVRVVYNPVAIKEGVGRSYSSRNIKSVITKSFVLVTTGRLVQIKNQDLLIKVFSRLIINNPDKKLELWIVGEGPERESLQATIQDLGVVDKVMLYGYQENVFPYLNQADAFILPSFSEGFSISLVEAMSSGLPCIATKIGGPSEIITSGTGYLIDPKDSNDILDKIQKVIDLPENERIELGRRAKEDVEKRFSVEKYVQDLMNCYLASKN